MTQEAFDAGVAFGGRGFARWRGALLLVIGAAAQMIRPESADVLVVARDGSNAHGPFLDTAQEGNACLRSDVGVRMSTGPFEHARPAHRCYLLTRVYFPQSPLPSIARLQLAKAIRTVQESEEISRHPWKNVEVSPENLCHTKDTVSL